MKNKSQIINDSDILRDMSSMYDDGEIDDIATKVLERDNYTCQDSGVTHKNGELTIELEKPQSFTTLDSVSVEDLITVSIFERESYLRSNVTENNVDNETESNSTTDDSIELDDGVESFDISELDTDTNSTNEVEDNNSESNTAFSSDEKNNNEDTQEKDTAEDIFKDDTKIDDKQDNIDTNEDSNDNDDVFDGYDIYSDDEDTEDDENEEIADKDDNEKGVQLDFEKELDERMKDNSDSDTSENNKTDKTDTDNENTDINLDNTESDDSYLEKYDFDVEGESEEQKMEKKYNNENFTRSSFIYKMILVFATGFILYFFKISSIAGESETGGTDETVKLFGDIINSTSSIIIPIIFVIIAILWLKSQSYEFEPRKYNLTKYYTMAIIGIIGGFGNGLYLLSVFSGGGMFTIPIPNIMMLLIALFQFMAIFAIDKIILDTKTRLVENQLLELAEGYDGTITERLADATEDNPNLIKKMKFNTIKWRASMYASLYTTIYIILFVAPLSINIVNQFVISVFVMLPTIIALTYLANTKLKFIK